MIYIYITIYMLCWQLLLLCRRGITGDILCKVKITEQLIIIDK